MAKQLWHHFHPVARKALERYGFAYADILSQWSAIVGEDLADASQPERIRWPRQTGAETAAGRRRKHGGTLIVRVADGRAIAIQHEVPRIIERVNTFYGYGAIAAVKIVQGPLDQGRRRTRREPPRIGEADERALGQMTAPIADDALREALMRLGRGVLAQRGRNGTKQ